MAKRKNGKGKASGSKKKRRRGKGKGGSYERRMAKRLSLWWTAGRRPDIYWRTAGSGNRATVRQRRGQSTYGSYGDLSAIDPVGSPLLDLVTISLKNGYRETHLLGWLDRPNPKKNYEFETWVREIKESWQASGSLSWVIIHQRRGRAEIIYMPWTLFNLFEKEVGTVILTPRITLDTTREGIVGMRLKKFLKVIKPDVIKRILKKH